MRDTQLARFSVDIAHRIARDEPFAEDLTTGLARLLDADAGVGLNCCPSSPSDTWTATVAGAPRLSAEDIDRRRAVTPLHPGFSAFNRVRTGAAVRISDVVDLRRFWTTRTYDVMHAREGGRYPAGAVVLAEPELLIMIGLQRSHRDFSEAEMADLTRIQQVLAAAFTFRHRLDEMVKSLSTGSAAGQAEGRWTPPTDADYAPTRREAEILTLAAAGWTNRRIAHRLGITERTVRKHLTNVYEKSATFNRAAAAVWWQRRQKTI